MRNFLYYISALCGLLIPVNGFCKPEKIKPFTLERAQYVADQLVNHGWGDDYADSTIFTKEFVYIIFNYHRKGYAEYLGEDADYGSCNYWYTNMDDYTLEDDKPKVKLELQIEDVHNDNASVFLTKTSLLYSDTEHFKMIFKYEDGDWRLDDFLSKYGDEYNRSQKQDAIDCLAAIPMSDENLRNQDISKIFEYHIYIDGKECGMKDAYDLIRDAFRSANADINQLEGFTPALGWGFDTTKLSNPEPIVSLLILTYGETGARKTIMCTCRPPSRNK